MRWRVRIRAGTKTNVTPALFPVPAGFLARHGRLSDLPQRPPRWPTYRTRRKKKRSTQTAVTLSGFSGGATHM